MTSAKRLASKVEDLKDNLEREIDDGLERGMEDTAMSMQRHLIANRSVATGSLLLSIDVVPGVLDETSEFSARRIVGAPHWKYVEYGTGIYTSPKNPFSAPDIAAPYAPIYRWIRAKGIMPDPTGPYDTQEELAEAIQHTVSRGTPMQRFARPAWRGKHGRDHVASSVADGMNKALRRAF